MTFLKLSFCPLIFPNGTNSVNLEKKITSELKLLKNKEIIDKSTYKSIKPIGSRPCILYRLRKIHKETRNGLPPFHPIPSAIGAPTYKTGKFFTDVLTPLTANEYTAITTIHFAE